MLVLSVIVILEIVAGILGYVFRNQLVNIILTHLLCPLYLLPTLSNLSLCSIFFLQESITDQTVANVTADFIRMYRFNADDSEDSTANDAAVDGVQRLVSTDKTCTHTPPLSLPLSLSLSLPLILQLQCCGATQGPGDWLVLNPGLFNQSNGQFPRSCVCELSQPNCARFVGTTSYMVDVNATVWSMVSVCVCVC